MLQTRSRIQNIAISYSVCSLVMQKMEEEISGTYAVKNSKKKHKTW